MRYKRLDQGLFEIPRPERPGDTTVTVTETAFEAIFAGLTTRHVH